MVFGREMIPIHELLSRIRWDPEFARGSFQLGYYDRAEDRVILVPFAGVSFPRRTARKRLRSPTRRAKPTGFRFTACARFTGMRTSFGIEELHRHHSPKASGSYGCIRELGGENTEAEQSDRAATPSQRLPPASG
jgi:hypothetical protein